MFQIDVMKKALPPENEDADVGTLTLEVSPLHLAIISRQESSLEVLLEEGATTSICNQMISAKVIAIYPSECDTTLYNDEDRMLDGMNILHLAAKYFPMGLEIIIRFTRKQEGMFSHVKTLLEEMDNQVKNTPLHVAASSSSVIALR